MRVFFEVLGAMAVALAFYQFGVSQGAKNCSNEDKISAQILGLGKNVKTSSGKEYFSLSRGKSTLLTDDDIVFVL